MKKPHQHPKRRHHPTRSTTLTFFLTTLLTINPSHTTTLALQPNSWQKRLDRAFLDVDVRTPEARIRSLQRAIQDPALYKDVSRAIDAVRTQGFGKGHPELIDILWPEGTIARRDLEGLQALTKQLPERFEGLDVGEVVVGVKGGIKVKDASEVVGVVVGRVMDDPKRTVRIAQNVWRSKPVEVETMGYEVVRVVGGAADGTVLSGDEEVEVRRYDSYQSVSCPLNSDALFALKTMGEGLNELSSYLLFGNNEESIVMDMTSPFVITRAASSKDSATSKMRLKLPKEYTDQPPAPEPSSEVELEVYPETVVATTSFSGICTEQEIERQLTKLIDIIKNDGTLQIKGGGTEPEIMVMQYNAPGTVPWRRRNDIGIIVEEQTDDSTDEVVHEDVVVEEVDAAVDDVVAVMEGAALDEEEETGADEIIVAEEASTVVDDITPTKQLETDVDDSTV